jgi:hypothetical protein
MKTRFTLALVAMAFSALADFDINQSADPPLGVSLSHTPGNPHPGPENIRLRYFNQFPLLGLSFLGWMENGSVLTNASSPTVFVTGSRHFVAAFHLTTAGTGTGWTDGVIPFGFAPEVSPAHRKVVTEAMDRWAFETGVSIAFVPWQGPLDEVAPSRSIYVVKYVIRPDANGGSFTAFTGMPFVKQSNLTQFSLGALNATYPGEVDHELGHVLGLHHTHQRQDRGNHIAINWDNLPDKTSLLTLSQFAIIKDSDWIPGTRNEPFDILSVMNYGNGLGITAKPSEAKAGIFNQFDYIPSIQFSDIKHLRNVYGTKRESRFVDNTGTGGSQVGSLSNPYRELNTGVFRNGIRDEPGSRLWVAPGTYTLGATRINGPQKILPYPGGGSVRIVR